MANSEGRERARRNVARTMRMVEPPVNSAELARRAGIKDPETVRAFLAGDRWPHVDNRARIERALGLEPGAIDAWVAGDDMVSDPGGPEVEGLLLVDANAVDLARTLLARLETAGCTH